MYVKKLPQNATFPISFNFQTTFLRKKIKSGRKFMHEWKIPWPTLQA